MNQYEVLRQSTSNEKFKGVILPLYSPVIATTSKSSKYGSHIRVIFFFQKCFRPFFIYDTVMPYPLSIRNIATPIPPTGVNTFAPAALAA